LVRTLLIVALIFLSGCTQITGERRAATKNVAVVVAVPDEASMTKVGLTVFNNAYARDRSTWGFDARLRQAVTEALRERRPDLAFVPVQYDPAEVLTQLRGSAQTLDVAPELIGGTLRPLVAGKPVDTIFLITPHNISYGSVSYYGVGIEVSATLRDLAPFIPRVLLRLHVIDAPSMTVLTSMPRQAEGKQYNLNRLLYPDTQAPAFPAGFTMPLNDAQRTFLRPLFYKLLDEMGRDLVRDAGF
jgi:hypothetical protein